MSNIIRSFRNLSDQYQKPTTRMKNILSIFVLVFCLASCKTEKAPQEEAQPAGPAEWVTYEGKEGAENIVLVCAEILLTVL